MIKAVIFDWAGTTVDYGSVAPVIAFQKAFTNAGINISADLIRRDMGMVKWDHIGKLLEMPEIQLQWLSLHEVLPTGTDRQKIYDDFEQCLMLQLREETNLKPFVLETIAYLKNHGIKIATTTGYAPEMMRVVQIGAAQKGYAPELVLTAEDVAGQGRPSPAMVQKVMANFGIEDPKEVIKVGDTTVDIEEGRNAGVVTVGIVEGSSLMGLSEREYDALSFEKKVKKCIAVKQEFEAVGADFTITDMHELTQVIEGLNKEFEVDNGR